MTRDGFEQLLKTLTDGWASRDYKRVIACFDDAVFYADPLNYRFFGREGLLSFFENDDGLEQLCNFHNSVFDEERQLGAAEYTYEGSFRYHGTAWINIEGEKIVKWREYQHRSERSWNAFWNRDN